MDQCSFCHKKDVKLSSCARCFNASYCSKECQRGDWPEHRNRCKPKKLESLHAYFQSQPQFNNGIKIEQNTKKGRTIIATKKYEPGEIIFSERACIYGVSYPNPVELVHQYIQLYSEESTSNIHGKVILELAASKGRDYSQTAKLLKDFFPEHMEALTLEELTQFLNILETNGMSGGNNETGLFLLSSMLCHSCKANAQYSTWGKSLYLCCVETINPGDEITISYYSGYVSTKSRRKHLQEVYGFHCECERCSILPDLYRKFVCPRCKIGAVSPISEGNDIKDWNCLDCNYFVSEAEIEIFKKAEIDCLEDISIHNVNKYIEQGKLHKSHYILFNAVDKEVQMIADPDDAVSKAKYLLECALTVPDYKGEIPSLYYLLSSAYKMKNQMNDAKEALKKVYECRVITNGLEAPRTLSSRREWMECPSK